jgi:hypothetical protein
MSSENDGHVRIAAIGLAAVFALGCFAICGCGTGDVRGQTASTVQSKGQRAPAMNGLQLNLTLRKQNGDQLLPEQCAYFDVELENHSSNPIETFHLDANTDTPVISLYSGGQRVAAVTHQTMINRFTAGGIGEPMPQPPALVQVAPGQELKTFFDLWTYTAPPLKGTYEVELSSRYHPSSQDWIQSNRVRFEIIDAHIKNVASGYEDIRRGSSIVLWVAVPEGGGQPLLLARLSTIDNHRNAQRSGNPIATVSPDTRVAIAAKPLEGTPNAIGWFAYLDNGQLHLVQHFRTNPQWRSGAIALPIKDAVPVNGFADREYAVFLATGSGSSTGGALTGVTVRPETEASAPWTTPLRYKPDFAACAFAKSGPISLLAARSSKDGSSLSRLDVAENGTVVSPEREVRASGHEILAVAVDQRPQQPQSFVILEADRARPNHLFLVRVPLSGDPQVTEIPEQGGWPVGEGNTLARAQMIDVEVAWNGSVLIALTDNSGRIYTGVLDATSRLTELGRPPAGSPSAGLHIAALRRSIGFAAFTDRGKFAFVGGR